MERKRKIKPLLSLPKPPKIKSPIPTNHSISKRWVVNSIGLIGVVLLMVAISVGYGMKQYYYTAAETAVANAASIVTSKIAENATNASVNMRTYIRNQVEYFDGKDRMEMMLINHSGEVVATSSGFPYEIVDALPDYQDALAQADGIGSQVFRLANGERVLAYTQLIPAVNSEYSAVRYIISTEKIDSALFWINFAVGAGLILILALILISNSYFIRSIVYPVKELTQVAQGFATGNLDGRIVKHSDDEIGELADVLNFMADEMQKTDQMQNEFISSVSHELRTPLTAIKGWGETLLTIGPEDEALMHSGMQVILKETERLSTMVEELLDFSRIQNGKLALTKSKMDVLAELDDAVLIYIERARRDGKTLLCNAPDEIPFIMGDRNRIKQVFINIIDNALKYSDSGGIVTIDVKVREEMIVVRITDTGCGIDSKDLPRIKEKFFKANVTRRGSGIGLAVADEIITLHQGKLLVESAPEAGTTVTIMLPVWKQEERSEDASSQEERSTDRAESEG